MFGDGADEIEQISRANEQRSMRLQEAAEKIVDICGKGSAADGLVRVAVGGGAALKRLMIDPRAMRLGSTDLAEKILEAANAASVDMQNKIERMMQEALGDDIPPAIDFVKGRRSATSEMEKVKAEFSKSIDHIMAEVDRLRSQLRS